MGLQSELGAKLRDARKERQLTQEQLAEKLNLTQSQVSSAEHAQFDRVSKENLIKIAEYLGLEPAPYVEQKARGTPRTAICPNTVCATNEPVLIGTKVAYRPLIISDLMSAQSYCRTCGEQLKFTCQCGAALADGIFCGQCGKPYVPCEASELTGPDSALQEAAARRRQQNREVLAICWTGAQDAEKRGDQSQVGEITSSEKQDAGAGAEAALRAGYTHR